MATFYSSNAGDIINLNVGGQRFSTSKNTLTWIPDTFFTSMLSGRISSLKDESGAIFIDRDPSLFSVILNYLRTRNINVDMVDMSALRHEAEFYGIAPLVKRLMLCQDLNTAPCGDVFFCGYLSPPYLPPQDNATDNRERPNSSNPSVTPAATTNTRSNHSRNPSTDMRFASSATGYFNVHHGSFGGPPGRPSGDLRRAHSRNPSLDLRHSRNSSADLNKYMKTELNILNNFGSPGSGWVDPLRVRVVKANHNWIVIAYAHFVNCYRNKDSTGWQLAFTSPHIDHLIERVALNAKLSTPSQGSEPPLKMLAISYAQSIRLWGVSEDGNRTDIGTFNLGVSVEYLFFIGSQLVALSSVGKIGVWHSMTQHWQIQDVLPIASFDSAGSFLLLGCTNGSIYYIDMQKFPLRMKDNDLLVTELYHDPTNDVITAISVYLTPKTNVCGNWIEIAYGTSSGTVRVIVQHPETVGHGPQLFQTFTVHRFPVTKVSILKKVFSAIDEHPENVEHGLQLLETFTAHRFPVTKVKLSEKLLISVCSEYNHVRTWSVTRFRGMISTQPGSTPLSSYKILTLDEVDSNIHYALANDCGPYGEQDDEQIFIQKIVPDTDQLFVRLASNGKRVCSIKSVDGTTISGFCVHECEGGNRMGSRPRRYIFTGHSNGSIQMWDLTTALELCRKSETNVEIDGSPGPLELLRLLDVCELSNSYSTTPCVSPFTPGLRPQTPVPLHPSTPVAVASGGPGPSAIPFSLLKPSNIAFLSLSDCSAPTRRRLPTDEAAAAEKGTPC